MGISRLPLFPLDLDHSERPVPRMVPNHPLAARLHPQEAHFRREAPTRRGPQARAAPRGEAPALPGEARPPARSRARRRSLHAHRPRAPAPVSGDLLRPPPRRAEARTCRGTAITSERYFDVGQFSFRSSRARITIGGAVRVMTGPRGSRRHSGRLELRWLGVGHRAREAQPSGARDWRTPSHLQVSFSESRLAEPTFQMTVPGGRVRPRCGEAG